MKDRIAGAGDGLPRFVWPAVALGISIAVLATLLSGVFTVQRVRIVGGGISQATVVRVAAVAGTNVFAIQTDAVVSRLDKIHEIEVARVDTSFPGEVTVYARPRTAIGAWKQGNDLYLVGADGTRIRRVANTGLPTVVAQGGSELAPAALIAVVYASRALPGTPSGSVAEYTYASTTGLTIRGESGWIARVGRGDARTLANRISVLVSLLRKLLGQPRHLTYVDLRFPVPYARFGP